MNSEPTFIVNSIDDAKYERFKASLSNTAVGKKFFDIIRITDAKSMSEGLNRGASRTKNDFLIFCHDDIEFISSQPIPKIRLSLEYYDVVGLAGTERLVSGNWYDAGQPYIQGSVLAPNPGGNGFELQVFHLNNGNLLDGTQALDGIFIACRRESFQRLNGFDATAFNGWHGYDVDFSYRAYLAGFKLCVATNVLVCHDSYPGSFSEEKLDAFERSQRAINIRFGATMSEQRGERTHRIINVDNREKALEHFRVARDIPLVPNT